MYAVRLTTEEFGPFIEKLDGDRKIEAYSIETEINTVDEHVYNDTYHSLVISGQRPQE